MSVHLCDGPFCTKKHFAVYRGLPKIKIDNIHNERKMVFCSAKCRNAWILIMQKNKKFRKSLKNPDVNVAIKNQNLIPVKGRDQVIKLLKEKVKKNLSKFHF